MHEADDWGRDPAVRRARALFGQMERAQREVLARIAISPFDERLRTWREEALTRFERSWRTSGEGDAAGAYRACFIRVLAAAGIEVPTSAVASSGERP